MILRNALLNMTLGLQLSYALLERDKKTYWNYPLDPYAYEKCNKWRFMVFSG